VIAKGRLLGIDFGTVRVGIAVSDSEQFIASPLSVYRRVDSEKDALHFRKLVISEEVVGFVVGLPIHMSGDEGQKAKEARAFGAWLAETTGLDGEYWDERYTTVDADEFMIAAGLTPKQRNERRDKVAAQILLQAYLDSRRKAVRG
jgi:putative Holliday junction resolvase